MKMNLQKVDNVGGIVLTGTIPTSPMVGKAFQDYLSEACACLTTNPDLNRDKIAAAFEKTNGSALLTVNSDDIMPPSISIRGNIGTGREM